MRRWLLGLAGLLAPLLAGGARAADALAVGPFSIEPVERRISAGGFPNTSGNPFKRQTITEFRVLHAGRPLRVAELPGDRQQQVFTEARVLTDAPRPALLLVSAGVVLLTEQDGQPRVQLIAPPHPESAQWQWLDSRGGQPGPVEPVGVMDRAGQARALAGGRWLRVGTAAVLDVRSLQVHTLSLNSTEMLDRLQRFYAAGQPAIALSPGGTQFLVRGNRSAGGGFEHALVAVEFAAARATALPIDLLRWHLPDANAIDAGFVARHVAWLRQADGTEVPRLRSELPPLPWLGRLEGQASISYVLQPARASLQDALAAFAVREFGAVAQPRPGGAVELVFGDLPLSLQMLRPEERRLSLFFAGDWRRAAEARALIERVAERFNARLAAGEHQTHFASDSR